MNLTTIPVQDIAEAHPFVFFCLVSCCVVLLSLWRFTTSMYWVIIPLLAYSLGKQVGEHKTRMLLLKQHYMCWSPEGGFYKP